MIFIDNQSRDGAYNHALEEYLIKNLKRELFMIWQNDNTVLLGRNQNPYKEVNWDYMNETQAKLVSYHQAAAASIQIKTSCSTP